MSAGARIRAPNPVTLTIEDDDDPPALRVLDLTVTEGATASFEVTLSVKSDREVMVSYETADGTAEEPDDYASTSGTLTFEAGDTAKTITVTTVNDSVVETGGETFTLKLSNPAHATLSGGASGLTATGTIEDNDALDLTVELRRG